MTGLSRRKLVVGALAAPVGVGVAGMWARAAAGSAVSGAMCDPVVARAAEWIAAWELAEAMQAEWRGLETRLFERAARLKMDCMLACRSGLAEARAMRALDCRIGAAWREMERLAGEAVAMPAVSMAGALAKIELGVRVQGEFDWKENALELVRGGIGEVRRLG